MKASLISGGIDSLFASLLALEAGEGPVGICGIFTEEAWRLRPVIKNTYNSLGIDVVFVEIIEQFREKIIVPFIEAYLKGLTPNPCCHCNALIKFGILYERAREMGLNKCISGHYARILFDKGSPSLYRGVDKGKEQSYFLSLIPRDMLSRIELPLGTWKKDNVSKEIEKRGIDIPCREESQEICFIPGDYRHYLRTQVRDLPGKGPIRGVWGEILGEHEGLYAYTIGQRRGLGISYKEPLYVIAKNIEENTLIVGNRDDLLRGGCIVGKINFLQDKKDWPERVWVKYNSRMKVRECRVNVISEKRLNVTFMHRLPRPTPGQICCFYSKEGKVLGGGEIES